MFRKKRDYTKEKKSRKTITQTFSCPNWIFDFLSRQKNKTEFIVKALEREINIQKDLGEKKRQLQYRKKAISQKLNKEIFEINEEIALIEDQQKKAKKRA